MDLPNLRRKPTYETLLQALENLRLKPGSWDDSSLAEISDYGHDASVNIFLMSVITSKFDWLARLNSDTSSSLTVDEQKENLIQEASKRVAERCGRSAAGEMTRTWVIPGSAARPEISFLLREPPLTGDKLGLKTWGTSYIISKKLEPIGAEYLGHLVNKKSERPQVLELGAGTGLVGMAAAAIWAANVVLTDLEEIQDNLLFNIDKNMSAVEALHGGMSGEVLDWTKPEEALISLPSRDFEIVIAADPMYDNEHPGLIANMINMFLNQSTEARALVAIPLRDAHTMRMAAVFSEIMGRNGFCVAHQGSEVFKDDWSTDEVHVQWTIWRRIESSTKSTIICKS